MLPEMAKGIVFLYSLPGRDAHLLAQIRIGQETDEAVGQGIDVAVVHEVTCRAVNHDVRYAPRGRADDGLSKGHRFQEHNAKAFLAARHGEELGFPIVAFQLLLALVSDKMNALVYSGLLGEPLQTAPVVPVAHHHVRSVRGRPQDLRKGAYDGVDALPRLARCKPPNREDESG